MFYVLEVLSPSLALPSLPLANGWDSFLNALPPALLGAILALLLAGPGRRRLQRLLRWKAGEQAGGRFAGSCESSECGLRDFAHEVETRLDAKLDRLERLLSSADGVLNETPGPRDPAGETVTLQEGVALGQDGPAARSDSDGAVEPELGSVTSFERERVLALAADGKSSEAISEAVGLIRGEVDLILRLYGRELSTHG